MAANSKFRVLYRQFLFRLMDVEMLASSAQGDTSGLLGQFGALLAFQLVHRLFAKPVLTLPSIVEQSKNI